MQFLRTFVVCSSVLWGCVVADAATHTVAPGQRIADALRQMAGGDTLLIQAGTYREGNLLPPSGSPGNPTVLQGQGQVVLAPDDQGVDTIFDFHNGAHDIVLDGLTLDAGKQTGNPLYSASDSARLTFQNGAILNARNSGGLLAGTGWTITNNDIRNNGTRCCGTHQDDHGLYFSASDSRIAGNRFSGNACYNVQIYGGDDPSNNVVEDNQFTDSKCGVTLTSGSNNTFRNNTVENDGTEGGGVLLRGSGTSASGNRITGTEIFAEGVVSGDVGGSTGPGAETPSVSTPRAPSQPSTRRPQRVATSVSHGQALRVLPHP
jgi:parallel beta-helix repeat protein